MLAELKHRGYVATGTIRDNRRPRECHLTSKKEMMKNKHSTHESLLCREEGITVAR